MVSINVSCSKDNHFLYASELFVYLKNYLHTLLDDTPHGLSKQMNKMLISFHEPDNPLNQVLYCSLGSGDYELVESFIRKYSSSAFPSKFFDYRGEEISIYPMPEGRFLAAYFTPDFLAISFQKRLVEQVIDARLSKKVVNRYALIQTDACRKEYECGSYGVCAHQVGRYGEKYGWHSFANLFGKLGGV